MDHIVTVDQALWGLLVAQILPLLVGFITHEVAKPGVREALLALLAGVTVWAQEVLATGSFNEKEAVLRFAGLFFAAVLSYFGWQRRTVAPAVQRSGLSVGHR